MLGIHLIAADFAELFKELFLALVEVLRREHLDDHMLVTASCSPQMRNAALTQAQDFAGLRASRYLDFHRAINGRHLYLVAQSGLYEGNRHFHNHIIAIALENLMRLDEDVNVEVAIATATDAGFAAAAYAHARTIVHTFRDIDLDFPRNLLAARAITIRAGILDNLTRAMAASAGRLIDHTAKGRIGHRLPRARTITIRAVFGTGTGLCPGSVTGSAGILKGKLYLFIAAEYSLLEAYAYAGAQIGALLGPVSSSASASPAAEEIAEYIAEYITEVHSKYSELELTCKPI